MSSKPAPKISKLPFIVTDLVCLGAALGIVWKSAAPIGGAAMLAIVACVALGAWACVTPFIRDHDLAVRLAESDNLHDTVRQIQQLKEVATAVQTATAQWHILQENSGNATAAMQKMATQLSSDAQNFAKSLQASNDAEKTALRLEVDKRKRAEADWLKILVALLDNTHALYLAGVRSGQANVVNQLGSFQAACRDIVRRVGLVAIEARPGEPFNPATHALADQNQTPQSGAAVAATLATGFSFQGQLVRPVLVALAGGDAAEKAATETPTAEVAAGEEALATMADTESDLFVADAAAASPDKSDELGPVV